MLPVTPPAPPEFTGISYDSASGTIALTWTSKPGKSYQLMSSVDLADWQDVDGVVLSGGTTGQDFGARRNTSPAQLELTNDASAAVNANGWVMASTA